jgi:glycosyltransferase involved in cell wall biosynthesis
MAFTDRDLSSSDVPRGAEALSIVHVFAPARFGGLERVVAALAAGQHERGHRVVVAALVTAGVEEPPVLADLRATGVPVVAIALPGRSYLRQVRALREQYAAHGPDIVHTHGYLADVLGAISARAERARLVSTVHGFTGGDRKNRVYEWLQRKAYSWFAGVIAVSRTVRDRIVGAGVDGNRVHTIRNAWSADVAPMPRDEARRSLAVPAGAFSMIWAGRVSHEKGLDVLVRALPALWDLNVHLTVLGDGPERARVEALASRLGVGHRVTWAGVVPAAAALLRAADVMVLSSRTEGTPIILLEAMAAGVPIVATAVGGVPDVVSRSEAMLVDGEDSVALADALRQVHDDPAQAASRASRARGRLIAESALAPWLDAHDRVYRSTPSSLPPHAAR